MRNIKEALKLGKPVVGTWLNSGSSIVAELTAALGFDFVCVDVEHSAVDLPQTQQLFQAICAGSSDCGAIVRLHGVDYSFVKRYLDSGASGVIAPLVRTKRDAERLVEATKYPPFGLRGVGYCRANKYGLTLEHEFNSANETIMVAVQIEHIEAVNNIDEILGVDGIDAVFIGPYDLSASMGITGQFEHADYLNAQRTILEACGRHRIAPGIHVVPAESKQVIERYDDGYRLLAYSLDIEMIKTMCQKGLAEIRKKLGDE